MGDVLTVLYCWLIHFQLLKLGCVVHVRVGSTAMFYSHNAAFQTSNYLVQTVNTSCELESYQAPLVRCWIYATGSCRGHSRWLECSIWPKSTFFVQFSLVPVVILELLKNHNASHQVSINISINKEELCADLECSGVVQGCVGVMVISGVVQGCVGVMAVRTCNVNPTESGLKSSRLHTKAWET